ncbi:MAG: hypothetical protein M3308_09320 [Actinomycetota bacterium]|nr:hypothetical protein [Actinomycetota bacterium]
MSFLSLIEDADGLFIVFDVTAEAANSPTSAHQPDCFWASLDHLATLNLRPPALHTVPGAVGGGRVGHWRP